MKDVVEREGGSRNLGSFKNDKKMCNHANNLVKHKENFACITT